jgi:hypothetical protein
MKVLVAMNDLGIRAVVGQDTISRGREIEIASVQRALALGSAASG